ncbi:30S ribosomal protein S12 methylthiotransferase RimO [Candidatus Latescibacterota bacterium]
MPENSPKAALITLGCPMNQVDSEKIMGGLVARGFDIVPEEEAEVIIVNTCGFIESAKEESIETALSAAEIKEHGNLKAVVLAGCLAERYGDELASALDEVDAVVGLDGRDSIPDLCLDLVGRQKQEDTAYTRVVTGPLHSAYLKIAEGCDNRCSYCTIPAIRGSFRSIAVDEIIRDAGELVSIGARELVLIGQDTTGYGRDLDDASLPALLTQLAGIDNLTWLRLLYTHPRLFTDELIGTINNLPQVIPYIDMPIQHIAHGVLDRMRRHTPPDHIRQVIDNLRRRIEGLVLRTSLIVGFPGETDSDFEELADFVQDARFERLGVFAYSPEDDTPAASMDDQVPGSIANARCETIMEIQAGITENFHRSLIGSEHDMIIDDIDTETGLVIGRTYMDAPDIDGSIMAVGSVKQGDCFCRVRITGADTYDLHGEVV